ncbi:MAG: exodeoxyribonuclease VII small subunit [Firmicutes bacterium]|nr:exodeoxyribonuclease VII small subunit [Bacillota bacterium]
MNEKNTTFESAMQRLEQIVRAMERGDVPLDESLKLFQEGTELVRSCGQLLDEAEMQIQKVVKGADGAPTMEDFADESSI